MKTDFYVYGLFAPGRIPELFYIGKGKGRRMFAHFKPSSKGQNPYKDAVIAKYPGCHAKILFANLTEDEAFAIEVDSITQTPGLTNLTNGGEGASGYAHTAEARVKISEANAGEKNSMYGKTLSEEHKAKISKAKAGENHHMYGKTLSEETKAKISKARAGEKNPRAKLTWPIVREIRERLAKGEKRGRLAKEFDVNPNTISKIKNNKLWKETK